MSVIYERIGGSYGATRRQDERIATLIDEALGDSRSVVNVGAGTGAYEPTNRTVLAIEPSETMIAQRPSHSARVIQASAESLPLDDHAFDAALAVNTIHHWTDVRAGLRELRRVARKRVVIFLRHPQSGHPFWLTEEYLPSLDPSQHFAAIFATILHELQPLTTLPVKLPRDCVDGLFTGYWARPERYLDAEVRRNISNFALAKEGDLTEGLGRLRDDLRTGAWDRAHGQLRSLPELDLGHRLLVAELA